jgi:hypothetical protein
MGLDPHLWNLYLDMYVMVTSRVRIGRELSRCIAEERGIRQRDINRSVQVERKSISDKSKIKSSVLQDWQYLYWYPNSSR